MLCRQPCGRDFLLARLMLPADYAFGKNFHSLDLPLSRSFLFENRWRLSLIGEGVQRIQQSEPHGAIAEILREVLQRGLGQIQQPGRMRCRSSMSFGLRPCEFTRRPDFPAPCRPHRDENRGQKCAAVRRTNLQ